MEGKKPNPNGRKKDSWISTRKGIYSHVNISGETNGTRKEANKEKRERGNKYIDRYTVNIRYTIPAL